MRRGSGWGRWPCPATVTRAGGSEAVTLFADRARQGDARFALTGETGPAVARLVARLDGMPLAIELAAARVEALGVAQLADRLDDGFGLLAGGDRLAPGRHRSLAAAVEWSYRLLGEDERRVFRPVSVFPGPFTLEAAEAVAGPGAGEVVLRLVGCSLVVPPREGPDGRWRYAMLETLRAYGAGLLAGTGEQDAAEAALARWAAGVAEQAAAGLRTGEGEAAAARRLDAEDATMARVLAWGIDHDADLALRLVIALGWWWFLRGRLAGQYRLLRQVAGRAVPGSDRWCAAKFFLIWMAFFLDDRPRRWVMPPGCGTRPRSGGRARHWPTAWPASREYCCPGPVRRGGRGGPPGPRGGPPDRVPAGGGAGPAQPVGSRVLYRRSARFGAAGPAGRAGHDRSSRPDSPHVRPPLDLCAVEAGDLAGAESVCAAALARSRDAGDLWNQEVLLSMMAVLDLDAGRLQDAAAHLREVLQLITRAVDRGELRNALESCGRLCAATGRPAEAVTVWAASAAFLRHQEIPDAPEDARRREGPLRQARQALGPGRARAAEQRGAAMTEETAAEYALMLTDPGPQPGAPGPGTLSARERELVALVARGRTDAQIAAKLYISIRTVRSHLDRIGDKTGCRRRVDLTRLALSAGLA